MAENLQLNEKGYESLRDDKHLSYVSQMPLAVVDGSRPASMADGLRQRVVTSGDVQKNWRFNYIDTGDGCATHRNGGFKVVLDSELLRTVNPQTVLNERGALTLSDLSYESLQGKSFSKKDRDKFTGKYQTERQVKKSPVWRELARGDQALLDQNVEAVFKFLKDTYNVDTGMAVILADAQNVSELRAWCLGRFDDYDDYGSSALGFCSLGNCDARLVRVGAGGAVEVPRSGAQKSETSLDAKVSAFLDSGKGFERNGLVWLPFKKDLVPQ